MTEERFNEVVEETLNEIRETLIVKGKEYRRNNNQQLKELFVKF